MNGQASKTDKQSAYTYVQLSFFSSSRRDVHTTHRRYATKKKEEQKKKKNVLVNSLLVLPLPFG